MSEKSSRYALIEGEVKSVLKNLSGRDLTGIDTSATFFDLGFDSLLLTQASQSLRQKFGVKISFRQLLEDLVSIAAVAGYLDEKVPAGQIAAPALPVATPAPKAKPVDAAKAVPVPEVAAAGGTMDRIVKQQLQLMARQLDLLRSGGAMPELNGAAASAEAPGVVEPKRKSAAPAGEALTPRYFGPYKPIDKSPGGGLTERQQKHLDKLIRAYAEKTPRSKAYTQKHRAHFADPRTIAGFRQNWKEMVYPIVVKHSQGARFWDLDGREYVDFTMGFGTNLWGHSPEFLTRAVRHQLRHGVEVGPQSAIAGKVAALMCELTGMERAAFCSTGSEAVLAAVRLARTITGRTKIATTSGYHGINDEVLVRASVVDGVRRPVPVAPGIPQHSVSEVLVLDYGTEESLELLRAHCHELAAVLIEPVQSRKPDLVPVEFLREVRKITAEHGTALIFDEIITGFRTHPGGTQALWGIKADLATYGKIIGGGMPCGALCGKATYMDALDGGNWSYGDGSGPEVGVTFFAGTYVRHPLAIRAALSVLTRLKREGPALQERLSERTDRLGGELNAYFERERIPMRMTWFRSMIYFVFQQEFKYSSLLFFHLRLKGLHIWEGRPVFLSTAHSDEDIAFIVRIFKESLEELREGDFLPEPEAEAKAAAAVPPVKMVSALSAANGTAAVSAKPIQFSLYFFGNYDAAYRDDKYSLLMEASKFADEHGFTAVWLPERHFHPLGGFSPNSSLLACALARETTKLQLRGGSVVLPLHHPVRVAEEWSMVDNLSQGRAAISIASGWHPNDFVFAPEAFADRRNILLQNLDIIRRLWRGDTVDMPTPGGESLTVKLFPQPKQRELPVWLTCIHKDSYEEAGRRGLNVLGYLMNQTVDELAEKIAAYREGRRSAGLDPAAGHVTTLLYTYLDETVEKARETARGPLCDYLRSYLDNSQKKIEKQIGQMEVDKEDVDYLTNRSCDDYFNGKSLVGTAASCAAVVEKLRSIGVDEIGCFVDFGVGAADVLRSLARVTQLKGEGKAAMTETDQTLPLPGAEKGIWLIANLNENAGRAYHESNTLSLIGDLDAEALARALQMLVDRHGALRTTIEPDGQSQTVHARHRVELERLDFSDLPPEQITGAVIAKLAGLENQIFAGMRGPFFRAWLIKLEAKRHLLLLLFHHVLGNGPSYWVFLDELAALYQSCTTGAPAQLPPAVPFAEFVEKRKRYEESEAKREAEAFWMKQMEGGVPALDLPVDYSRPAELTHAGAREEIVIDAGLIAALKKAGAAHRCSLFMTLLSAYGLLLHRLSGQDDLVIAVPFDSPIRTEEEGRNLFANTTNMLPLRSILYDGSSFADYLLQMKNLVIAASEHQDYFFGNLIGKLNLPRDPSRPPVFNVTFNLESGEFHRTLPGLEITLETDRVPYRSPIGTAMFELYLNAAEKKNGEIFVQCDYNTDLIAPETMRRWLRHYKTLLRGIAGDPNQPAALIPLMTAEEQQELVVAGKPTAAGSPA
ncbi:MAG TPA: MupA/Atu3671 family FMN-dependent luciferase-like monooxygenase [Candidatus Methylacidiphilales bacterium]|jgi:natural product biosynthesis luciferase-like monooxygenase protein|nr:MupA/Atu3671 family FMN-dependent luciferase-like monooxygenase [Candidatus Methylacidiphilales bacterium]